MNCCNGSEWMVRIVHFWHRLVEKIIIWPHLSYNLHFQSITGRSKDDNIKVYQWYWKAVDCWELLMDDTGLKRSCNKCKLMWLHSTWQHCTYSMHHGTSTNEQYKCQSKSGTAYCMYVEFIKKLGTIVANSFACMLVAHYRLITSNHWLSLVCLGYIGWI
jgi:hypothetical protein